MDIRAKLNEFDNRRREIFANADLSKQGRDKALQALNSEAANVKGDVLRELRGKWDGWKADARYNVESLREANERAAAGWDYARLNYMEKAVNFRVGGADSFADVASEYQRVKESGDRHALRAWTETAGATIRVKFGNDPEALSFVRQLSQDAAEVVETPEVKELKAEGERLSREAAELDEQTEQARAFYYPNGAGVFGVQDEFETLREGVSITRRVEPETLATVTAVRLTD